MMSSVYTIILVTVIITTPYKFISLDETYNGEIEFIGRAKRAPQWGVQSRFRMIYIHCKLKSVPCTPKCLYTHTVFKKVCIETFLCALHTSFFTMYICRFVCPPYVKMRRRNYVAQTRACSKSVLGG